MSYYMGRHVEREILSALIDGELEAEERRFVHEHLQACGECRETVDEFSRVHGLVGELPRLVAPESFVTDVLVAPQGGARRATAARVLRGRRRWVVAGLAAATIATTLSGLVLPPETEPVPVGAYVERHVGIHSGGETGAQFVFTVNGR